MRDEMLNTTFEIKEYFKANPDSWSKGYILGYHCAKLALLKPGENLDICGFKYLREADPHGLTEWDPFYVQTDKTWVWVGNLSGAIEHYSANFTQTYWNGTQVL